MPETTEARRIDGRKNGLSTLGLPLREIIDRADGIHTLSCGHRVPRPAESTDYDLRKSRRCIECGPKPPIKIYTQAELDAAVEQAVAKTWEKAIEVAGDYDPEIDNPNDNLHHSNAVVKLLEAAKEK